MIFYLDVRDSASGRTKKLKMIYVADQVPANVPRIKFEKELYTVHIGIGARDQEFTTFTRDLGNDVIKGIGCRDTKSVKKHTHRLRKIDKVEFVGRGKVTQITLANLRYEVSQLLLQFSDCMF